MPRPAGLSSRTLVLALALTALASWCGSSAAQGPVAPAPAGEPAAPFPPAFSAMPAGPPGAGWRIVGLPGQRIPATRFAVVPLEGRSVLRVQADASYGNLVFDARGMRLGPDAVLRWSWRLERGLAQSDLSRKAGDDAPVKVCALFDMPLGGMAFGEQTRLRLARAMAGEDLPAATLCYVWDRLLPEGSELANVFSARVRYLVASQGHARMQQWVQLERRLGEDFLRAFGHESAVVPPLLALAVGADADNTGGHSLAFVGDLRLRP